TFDDIRVILVDSKRLDEIDPKDRGRCGPAWGHDSGGDYLAIVTQGCEDDAAIAKAKAGFDVAPGDRGCRVTTTDDETTGNCDPNPSAASTTPVDPGLQNRSLNLDPAATEPPATTEPAATTE